MSYRLVTIAFGDLTGLPKKHYSAPVYTERFGDSNILDGWDLQGNIRLNGSFLQAGKQQLYFINTRPSGGHVMVANLPRNGNAVTVAYWEDYGQSQLLDGWHDADDLQLAGDFVGEKTDQVMFINRGGGGGRVMVVDYSSGQPITKYFEAWGQSNLLDGWLDSNDQQIVGDFMHLGYDQVMLINQGGAAGRIMIVDFNQSPNLAITRYFEAYGDYHVLDGWLDADDLHIVGDFMHLGYDQILFINRGGDGGRAMIMDFSAGPPGVARYFEAWGQNNVLDGWHDAGDLMTAGDFLGYGYDQLLLVNRDGPLGTGAGLLMVADFSMGGPPFEVPYFLADNNVSRGLKSFFVTEMEPFAGDFVGTGRSQLVILDKSGISAPDLDAVQPNHAAVGDTLVLSGAFLSSVTSVRFGGADARFSITSDRSISVTVPRGVVGTVVPILASNAQGSSNNVFFTFEEPARPLISGISPTHGSSETHVVITGDHLGNVKTVTFAGTAAAFQAISNTTINTRVPVGAASGPIRVTGPGGSAESNVFTVDSTGVGFGSLTFTNACDDGDTVTIWAVDSLNESQGITLTSGSHSGRADLATGVNYQWFATSHKLVDQHNKDFPNDRVDATSLDTATTVNYQRAFSQVFPGRTGGPALDAVVS